MTLIIMKAFRLSRYSICFLMLMSPVKGWIAMTRSSTPILTSQIGNSAAITVAFGAALCVTATAPQQANAADVAQGAKMFDATCASCHANGQNLIAKEKTLTRESLSKYVGLDPGDVQTYMRYNVLHRGANLFGGKLSEKDMENVVAYVLDQALEDKW